MALDDAILDGSSATWTPVGGNAAGIAPLTNFSYDDAPAEVDDTGAADSARVFEAGRSDETAQVDGLGSPAANIGCGNKGVLAITLHSGGSVSISPAVIVEVTCEGSIDQPIKSTVKVVPTITY